MSIGDDKMDKINNQFKLNQIDHDSKSLKADDLKMSIDKKLFHKIPASKTTAFKFSTSTSTSTLSPNEQKTLENDIAHSESTGVQEQYTDDYYEDSEEYYDEYDSKNDTAKTTDDDSYDEKLIPTKIDETIPSESSVSTTSTSPKPETTTKNDAKPTVAGGNRTEDEAQYEDEYSNFDDDADDDEDDDDQSDSVDNDDDADDDEDEDEEEADTETAEKSNDNNDRYVTNSVNYNDGSSNLKCPRDCVCSRNSNNFLVATCSRFDVEIQKFDESITDLQIMDIDPKYPVYLGDEIFRKIGLAQVASIKITNTTIEYVSPTAFVGLDKLYSLNLSRTGIEIIHPDAFATNLNLRLLTLSGNDLSNMQHKISPYTQYMLKAPAVEELDISNCNIRELLPTAFNELKNVVFINLSNNKLSTLPENIFDKIETIEEIDLSFNFIERLPKSIFSQTALAILNMKYNLIANSLDFITGDLQRLDLSYNQIKTINSQMFKKMDNINHLILKGNGIRKIHQLAFLPLKNLRYIDLSFNDLDQIASLTFSENLQLDVVKLNDNRNLRKLPSEGFENVSGKFKVYMFDVSNCDIEHINENTFQTMPLITILKLNGNRIRNLGNNVFNHLPRLIDLDLSNNVLEKIHNMVFWHNKNLNKINLSGNPIKSISQRAFIPTTNLSELDLSDCDLKKIWDDSFSFKYQDVKIFSKLRYLNISLNEIKSISRDDLENLASLKILDITNNPFKCDEKFVKLIKYLQRRDIKLEDPLNGRPLAPIYGETIYTLDYDHSNWKDLSKIICEETKSQNKIKVIENNEDDGNYDDDDDSNESEKSNTKEIFVDDTEFDNGTDMKYDDKYDDDEYDENETNNSKQSSEFNDAIDIKFGKNEIGDEQLIVKEIDILQKFDDKLLSGFGMDENKPRYDGYRSHYLWPIAIVLCSVVCVLFIIARVVSIIMKKRGERYRQAILNSKNSIIYQKLSEEITPPTPKVHRYQPIQQV
jgi:Leucine-rich repeat (LRR) protein